MSKQQYILRYYLPIKPYFDEEYTEKRFDELLLFCKETKTDAVMFYVALSPDWYYMPDTVEYAREACKQMLPYIRRLREAGISYQLNFQNLVGSTLGGVDFSKHYDWENLVDHKGRESLGCGCPIGEKFRAHAGERLRIWAETQPDIIWIDDDLRMHNHGTPILAKLEGESSYVDYYCFCDEHLRRFNQKHGTDYDRESLVKEITTPGKPSKARKMYLDFLEETITETAEWIRKTVQDISPNTRLAQMTSRPDVHAAEGRNWKRFLDALCGEYTPVVRAHFGQYVEKIPRDFVRCYKMLAQTMAQIREMHPEPVEYCPEVENTRFTTWAKSSRATSFQLALSAFMGCRGITLSIYDLEGGSFADEPLYEAMLSGQKEFLDRIVDLNLSKSKDVGVVIPTSGTSGRSYNLRKGETYENIGGTGRYVEDYLMKAGIPCCYRSIGEMDENDVVALDGFSAGFLRDDELQKILCGGVFLEGEAANILCERGFGEQIGIVSMEKQSIFVNAEVIHTFQREDGTYIRIPSRIPVRSWYEVKKGENTEALSSFLTPTGHKTPGLLYYENKFGGRVAVYPASKDWGDGFYTHHRVKLFKDMFSKLSPKIPRIDCHSYTLTAVKTGKAGEQYYFVANLATDFMENVIIKGKKLPCKLDIFEAAIWVEKSGEFQLLGTTRKKEA